MTTALNPQSARSVDLPSPETEPPFTPMDARAAGVLTIASVALSVTGAALLEKVDVFTAMQTESSSERAQLLTEIAGAQTQLVAGLVFWMFAFPAAAGGVMLLARLGRPSPLTALIRLAATASMGAMTVFLSLFVTFVAVIAPAHAAGEDVTLVAQVVGFAATTMDWTVSAIILGLAPAAAVFAGRTTWAPRWLQALAAVTTVVAAVEIVALIANNRDLLFPLVPAGLLLQACAGICALRAASGSVR